MRVKVSLLWLFLIIVSSLCVNPVVGLDKAPDFTLDDIDGNPFTLSEQLGKVVFIDFFGTQCPLCDTEVEELKILYNKYLLDPFIIVSISVYGTDEEVRDYAQEYDIAWRVALDTSYSVSYKYDVYYLPALFIIDTEGYIRKKYAGRVVEASVLSSEIDPLLSGTGNGDSEPSPGDSDTGPPYTLIAVIVIGVIVFLVIGIVVAGQLLGWSETPKKGHPRKRPRKRRR